MNELRDQHIRTEHLHADLRARSVRGAAVSLATRAVSLAINFASLAVLARLLGKEDFGLVFTVTAVTFQASPLTLRDLGSAIWRPTVASIIAGACLFGAGRLISPGGPSVLNVLRDLTIFSVAYLASWTALPGGRRALREVTGLAGDLRPMRGAAAAARRGSAASSASIAGATS